MDKDEEIRLLRRRTALDHGDEIALVRVLRRTEAELAIANGRADILSGIVHDTIVVLPGYGDSPDGVAVFVEKLIAAKDARVQELEARLRSLIRTCRFGSRGEIDEAAGEARSLLPPET